MYSFVGGLEAVRQALPYLLIGAVITIKLSILAMALGLTLGLVAALSRLSRIHVIRRVAAGYVQLIRGTPLLVQLFMIYYGLPQFGIRLEPFTAAMLGLGINYGAYLAEVYRAGILSIDRGQWEAGYALNMSWRVLMFVIILPQAVRVILPPVGNYFISMLKDTSLAGVVAVTELLREGQIKVAETFRAFEIYGTVAMIYLLMSYPLGLLTEVLERRTSKSVAA
jgi:His/Glu/Gln/Arg/opine family amino acid ABC transporter permease subunit